MQLSTNGKEQNKLYFSPRAQVYSHNYMHTIYTLQNQNLTEKNDKSFLRACLGVEE